MNIELMLTALTHVIYGQLRRFTTDRPDGDTRRRLAGTGAVVRRRRRRRRRYRRNPVGEDQDGGRQADSGADRAVKHDS